jgi:hypothetical protein
MSLIHPWNRSIVPWNKDCLWRTGEISYRTESTTKLLIAFYLPIGIVAAVVVVPCPGSTVYIHTDYGGSTSRLPSGAQPSHPRPSSPFWWSNAHSSYLTVSPSPLETTFLPSPKNHWQRNTNQRAHLYHHAVELSVTARKIWCITLKSPSMIHQSKDEQLLWPPSPCGARRALAQVLGRTWRSVFLSERFFGPN